MENNLHETPNAAVPYDYRQYDRIWQRVAPSLSPYPSAVPAANMTDCQTQAQTQAEMQAQAQPQSPAQTQSQPPAVPEANFPGAALGACCMGTSAKEMMAVLEGFIEDELADRRYYFAFARQAPASARQILREIALDESEHARRLMAVCYLITGRAYQPTVSCDRIYIGPYCPALRERYHAEACGGMNYMRAAEETTDPCLQKVLRELSDDEYRHAAYLMTLLERTLPGSCNGMQTGV